MRTTALTLAALLAAVPVSALADPAAGIPAPAAPQPLASLDLTAYLGTWYQVAWFPNRFQQQCVSDTSASYRRVPEGVEVTNRCRTAEGRIDSVVGLARPAGAVIRDEQLQPAQLEVSFLPSWLRWLPIWGSYWVLDLADDGRYAVVGEASREYLWVLSRTPTLAPADETAIRSRLVQQGYPLARWQNHPHTTTTPAAR